MYSTIALNQGHRLWLPCAAGFCLHLGRLEEKRQSITPSPPKKKQQLIIRGTSVGVCSASGLAATAAELLDDARAAVRVEADDDPEEDEDGGPDEEVHRQVRLGLRHHEGEHQAGVGHHEGPAHVARVNGHPHQQAQRHHHGARKPHPARAHEHPVPAQRRRLRSHSSCRSQAAAETNRTHRHSNTVRTLAGAGRA